MLSLRRVTPAIVILCDCCYKFVTR
jgi:hypothetical protein